MAETQSGLASGAMARVTAAADLLDQPDVQSARSAGLSLGSRVRVLEAAGDWVRVELMGIKGYIRREVLEPL